MVWPGSTEQVSDIVKILPLIILVFLLLYRCVLPDAVVWPGSTEQVSDVVKICHHHRIPMIPFGTGTGFEGGSSGREVNHRM